MHGVLERSSALLDHLAAQPAREWTVGELSAALNLPTSTTHRLLRDLHALGWVDQRSPRGGYRLGPRAYALTSQQPYQADIIQRAQPVMQQLADHFDLPVLLATFTQSTPTYPVGMRAADR